MFERHKAACGFPDHELVIMAKSKKRHEPSGLTPRNTGVAKKTK
jgi:hypothetical protein